MQMQENAAFAHGRPWARKPAVSRHPYFTKLSALRGLLRRGRWGWVTRKFKPLAHVYTQRHTRDQTHLPKKETREGFSFAGSSTLPHTPPQVIDQIEESHYDRR